MDEIEQKGPNAGPEPEYDPDEMHLYECDNFVANDVDSVDLKFDERDHYAEEQFQAQAPALDPMVMSAWSWFMVLAWVCWRTAAEVQECCDEYRANCWSYRTETIWRSRTEGPDGKKSLRRSPLVTKRSLQPDPPMERGLFGIFAAYRRRKMKLSIEAAEDQIRTALVKRELVAIAESVAIGRPVEIPPFEWAHIKVNSRGELCLDNVSNLVAYKNVKFLRTDVTNLWPSLDRQELLTSTEPTSAKKYASSLAIKSAVSELIKNNKQASIRDADALATKLNAPRPLVRAEVKAAREKAGCPVRRGRPTKA